MSLGPNPDRRRTVSEQIAEFLKNNVYVLGLAFYSAIISIYSSLISFGLMPPLIESETEQQFWKIVSVYTVNTENQNEVICNFLSTDPDDITSRNAYETTERSIKLPWLARNACAKVLQAQPTNAQLIHQEGRALEAEGATEEADELFIRAAKLGYAPALTRFGLILLRSPENCSAAFEILQRAASGSAEAQYRLGVAEFEGSYQNCGVAHDIANGRALIISAAHNQDKNAIKIANDYKIKY